MIADGDTVQALDAVLQALPQEHQAYDKFIQLRGQWKSMEESIHLGLIDRKSAATDQNRISHAMLEFIKRLPDSAFTQISSSQAEAPKIRDLVLQMSERNATEYSYDLFFCFSNNDLENARLLCDSLRGYGLRVFFSADEMRLKGGHQFSKVIDGALETSRHFLLYCTPNAMQSDWVQKEYRAFHDNVHISDQKNRSFLIFEGNDFDLKSLPITYRNNQRIRSIDEIISCILPAHSAQVVKPLYENKEKFVRQKSTSQKDLEDDSIEEEGIIARIAREYGEDEYRVIEAKPFPTRLVVGIGVGILSLFFIWFLVDKYSKSTLPKNLNAKIDEKNVTKPEPEKEKPATAESKMGTRKSGFTTVPVSGGTFTMGCKTGRDSDCENNEFSAHEVTLTSFSIGIYEVTQADWREIMDTNPSRFKHCDECPVEQISWDNIQDFLRKVNMKFPDKRYRLPTEAEWEFAARGGNLSMGYNYSGGNTLEDVGWFALNSTSKTHPVGIKKSNELGIFDMSGNVSEWCSDWASDWYGNYFSANLTNPTGAKSGSFREIRGGSWSHSASEARAANRYGYFPSDQRSYLGFRLVSIP